MEFSLHNKQWVQRTVGSSVFVLCCCHSCLRTVPRHLGRCARVCAWFTRQCVWDDVDAVCSLYFLNVGGYFSVRRLCSRCFTLCVCEGVCFSYQQRAPGHPCLERPAEGPAAPCPCSLWSHHGRTSQSTACACWLWKRQNKVHFTVFPFFFKMIVSVIYMIYCFCLNLNAESLQ